MQLFLKCTYSIQSYLEDKNNHLRACNVQIKEEPMKASKEYITHGTEYDLKLQKKVNKKRNREIYVEINE